MDELQVLLGKMVVGLREAKKVYDERHNAYLSTRNSSQIDHPDLTPEVIDRINHLFDLEGLMVEVEDHALIVQDFEAYIANLQFRIQATALGLPVQE